MGVARRSLLPQRQAIKKIALSRPADHGLAFSTWSLTKLAEFLVAEGVVDDVSHEGRDDSEQFDGTPLTQEACGFHHSSPLAKRPVECEHDGMNQPNPSSIDWTEHLAVQALLTSYATSCDDRDWDRYRSVFTDYAHIDYTEAYGISGSRDEVAEWIEIVMTTDTLISTQHMLTNFRTTITGDEASGRVDYFNPDVILNHQQGMKELLMNGGYYDFTAHRVDGNWQMSRLTATILWSNKTHLSVVEPPTSSPG